MSAWLLDKCIAYAKAHRHPELTEQTIWECQLAWSSYSDRDWQPVQNNAFTGGTTGNATAGVSWSALDVANMITGSLTLNGLDDEDMQLIFEMRAKTPLLFNPSGTTIRTKPGVAAKPGHIQAYNNVVMGWTEGSGLAAVMEILKRLNEAHPQT
jgi:hypothetical protein